MKALFVIRNGEAVDASLWPADARVVNSGRRVEWEGGHRDAEDGTHYHDQDGALIGWRLEGGALKAPPPPAPDLEDLRAALLTAADTEAERQRWRWITPGAGQALTYQEKAAELARYEADASPVKTDYPLLSAEIGITAGTLKDVAATVRYALDLWREKGAAIERRRLQIKAEIADAKTTAALETVDIAAGWPN